MGVIAPLAHGVDELYRAQIEGRSGIGLITHFNAECFPTRIAAEVKGFDLARYVKHAERWAYAGANTRFALAAAQQALTASGVLDSGTTDRTRCGLYLGTGEGDQDFHALVAAVARGYAQDPNYLDVSIFTRECLHTLHPAKEYEKQFHTTTAHVAAHFDLQGPNFNCLTACAAGTQAIGEAAELIRHGDADLMLTGGTHSMVHPFGLTGFSLLSALSTHNQEPTKASRPFDRNRDGFVLGEGAGMLVLEELEHARQRGALILAELVGYGSTADAYRVTDSQPEGRGAAACMATALADGRLSPTEIGYINAHGTSTQVNDRAETLAIKRVFGEAAYRVPISSSKSMLGHLIGAAGAVELIITIKALCQGVLPPTINYEEPDPECDLDYIPNRAREQPVRHALSNSFGFGGQNSALVVSRWDGR
jgi:3-oxoacyl-[acyl-carrier-protein] synthase II